LVTSMFILFFFFCFFFDITDCRAIKILIVINLSIPNSYLEKIYPNNQPQHDLLNRRDEAVFLAIPSMSNASHRVRCANLAVSSTYPYFTPHHREPSANNRRGARSVWCVHAVCARLSS
jgi:hypothetical protein